MKPGMQCLIFKTMFMHASQIAAYQGETIIAANPSLTTDKHFSIQTQKKYHCGLPNMTIKKKKLKVPQVALPVGLLMPDSAQEMPLKESSSS